MTFFIFPFSFFISTLFVFLSILIEHPPILVFLLLNLFIGFWAHRRSKVNSFEDYALASRSLPTGVLVLTLLATCVDNGFLSVPDFHFQYGFIQIIAGIYTVFMFVVIGTFIAPYLVYFDDCITLGDLMNNLYGRIAQLITGVIACIVSLLVITSQVRAIGVISTQLLGITPSMAIICLGSIIVLYSVWGGMRVVSYTDVVQIIGALIVFSWVGNLVIQRLEGMQSLWKGLKLYPEKANFFRSSIFYHRLKSGFFYNGSTAMILSLPVIQRMLVVQDKRSVRHMWYGGAALYAIIRVMAMVIGLGLIVGKKKFNLAVQTENLFPDLIQYLFKGQAWIIDFMFVGLLGMLLSTMDSHLHATGISVIQDVINPIRVFFGKDSLSGDKKTFYSKIGIGVIGIVAIILGLFGGSSLHSRNLIHGVVFVSTMLWIPLIIGIVGVKTDNTSWLSFCLSYLSVIFVLSRYNWHRYDYFLVALPTGIIFYFIAHVVQNGGLVTLKRSKYTIAEQLWLSSWAEIIEKVYNALTAICHLPELARKQASKAPIRSLPFSLLVFSMYTFESIFVSEAGPSGSDIANFTAAVHLVGIILCCGLMLEGIWPARIKPYFPLYWLIAVFYCLPLGNTLTFLRTHNEVMDMGKWISSFILLAALVDGLTFIVLALLGIITAVGTWKIVLGSLPLGVWNSIWPEGGYLMVILAISVLLFAKRKEAYMQKRLYWNRVASNTLGHELRGPLQMLGGVGNVLQNAFKIGEEMKNKQGDQGFWIPEGQSSFLHDFSEKMIEKAQELKNELGNFTKFIEQQVFGVFEQEKVSIHNIVKQGISKAAERYAHTMKISISCEKDFSAKVIKGVFSNVLTNLIKNASVHGQASRVDIKIDGIKRKVYVRDNGSGIPPDVLPRIFDLHYTTNREKDGTGVGLAFVKMTISSSGGKVSCQSRHGGKGSFTEFVIELPQK